MALLWVWLLCGLLCCVSVRGTVGQMEIPQFIYHSHKHLLLATTPTSCYFIQIDNATAADMEHDDLRLVLEHRIMNAIWANNGVIDTTLVMVMNMFEDRLADFHCLDKNIHLLGLHDCPHAQHPDTFQLMADVAFLLDVSTSVTDQDFRLVKQFIDAMTQHFDFGPHGLQVSVTEYDRFPHLVFDFNTYHRPDDVNHAIDQLREVQSAQNTDQTFTGAALHFIRDHVFTAMSGDRHEAPNVLVIISDGSNFANQDHQELVQQAQLLHNDGVQIIVIGIGDDAGDQSDLAQIANDGFSFLHRDDYIQLHDHGITDYIRNVLCTEVYAHTSPP